MNAFRWAFLLLGIFAWAGAARADGDLVKRGEYLAHAADCAACHMGAGGKLTGGRAFETPFGTIYAPNITPDKTAGTGDYTDDEWVSALREGKARGGKYLYPAMPYTSYALMSREDALAIKAYIMSLPPEPVQSHENRMKFPFNIRPLMIFWNVLYKPHPGFEPDTAKSAAWNRGAYLAEALGHCQQCHTPRNILQGLKTSQAYAGAVQQGWLAYNITSDKTAGVGDWSEQDLAAYLSTGHAANHGVASGPMGEAVSYSLRYLTPDDTTALATYLKTIPAIGGASSPPATTQLAEDALGGKLFAGACASCHRVDGTGTVTPYAALLGDQSVSDPNGTNLVRVLLEGSKLDTAQGTIFMPSFGKGYTDDELAALANYTIAHFGQKAGAVTAGDVAKARSPGQAAAKVQAPST